jgi:hypothetical protein
MTTPPLSPPSNNTMTPNTTDTANIITTSTTTTQGKTLKQYEHELKLRSTLPVRMTKQHPRRLDGSRIHKTKTTTKKTQQPLQAKPQLRTTPDEPNQDPALPHCKTQHARRNNNDKTTSISSSACTTPPDQEHQDYYAALLPHCLQAAEGWIRLIESTNASFPEDPNDQIEAQHMLDIFKQHLDLCYFAATYILEHPTEALTITLPPSPPHFSNTEAAKTDFYLFLDTLEEPDYKLYPYVFNLPMDPLESSDDDPFYYDSDDSSIYDDDIPDLQDPNISIEELDPTDGNPTNPEYYWAYNDADTFPSTDRLALSTTTGSCLTYLSRPDPVDRDPPGLLIPSHDNLSYIDTDPAPQDPSLPQDPAGISLPATWTYPPPPAPAPAPFVKQTNSPPPLTTLRLQPVNDINKIDNTWTAKALATVAHTLLWNTATPVGRWAHVPPLKKLRSKKMKMDAQAAPAA